MFPFDDVIMFFSHIIRLQRVEHPHADCSLFSEVALKNIGRDHPYETQEREDRVYNSWYFLETHVPYFGDIYYSYVFLWLVYFLAKYILHM